MTPVRRAAKRALEYVVVGADDVWLTASAPRWVQRTFEVAAGEGGLDSYRMAYLNEALIQLANTDDEASIRLAAELDERTLIEWLYSQPRRAQYCDQAIATGKPRTGLEIMSMAQMLERREVIYLVGQYLEYITDRWAARGAAA